MTGIAGLHLKRRASLSPDLNFLSKTQNKTDKTLAEGWRSQQSKSLIVGTVMCTLDPCVLYKSKSKGKGEQTAASYWATGCEQVGKDLTKPYQQ